MSQFESIRSTLNEKFPSTPNLLTNTMDLFCQTHVFCSAYMQANDFYDNDRENQLESIFIATGIKLVGNQFKTVDKTLAVLIISKCALDIIYAYRELTNKWMGLEKLAKETFPLIYLNASSDSEKKHISSAPLFEMVKIALISKIIAIKLIALSLFELIGQLFKTSMSLRDIYLVCHEDKHKQFEVLVSLISKHEKYLVLFNQQLAELGDEMDHLVVLTSSFFSALKLNIDKNEVQEILFTLRSKVNQKVQIMVEEGKNTLKSIIDPHVLKAPSIELINPNAYVNFIPDDYLPRTPEFTGMKVMGLVNCTKEIQIKEVVIKKEVTLAMKVFKYLNYCNSLIFILFIL